MARDAQKASEKVRRLTHSAMLLCVIFALSAFEHMTPPLPFLPPGVRLGLANVALMYSLFVIGWRNAAVLCALKACFILLSRGLIAGAMSLAGGSLSVIAMAGILALAPKASYLAVSVAGALAHNCGQIGLASILAGTNLFAPYLPYILVGSALFGTLTAALLRAVMPYLEKLERRKSR